MKGLQMNQTQWYNNPRNELAALLFGSALSAGVVMCFIVFLTGCSSSSIHNQARTITYIALELTEADQDDAQKVQAIAGVGLAMVAEGEGTDHISNTLLNLVKTQFSGRRAGLIEILYLDVAAMVESNISIDIPEAYRVALSEAFAGVIQGAEFYIADLEE